MKFDPKVPPSLLNLQKWFGQIETRPIREVGEFKIPLYDSKTMRRIEERITPGPKLSASQRIGLYNQQHWWRFFILIQEQYPALLRLFGYSDFNQVIVEPYLLKYYPNHWSLSALGSRLPRWIEEEYLDEDRVIIRPMAMIEEAYERLWYVPALPTLKRGEESHSLYIQPYIALFALDADFFSFREQLIGYPVTHWEENDFPEIDWSPSKRYFVLFPLEDELSVEEISSPEYVLLKAFEEGATIAEGSALLDASVLSDIGSSFQKWVSRGWLITEAVFLSDWETERFQQTTGVSS